MARVWRSVILLAMSLAAVIAFQVYLDDMMAGMMGGRAAETSYQEPEVQIEETEAERAEVARSRGEAEKASQ